MIGISQFKKSLEVGAKGLPRPNLTLLHPIGREIGSENVSGREKKSAKGSEIDAKKKAGDEAEAEKEIEARIKRNHTEEITKDPQPHPQTIAEAKITEDRETEAKITDARVLAVQRFTA